MTSSENIYAPTKRDFVPNLENEDNLSKESVFSIDFFCCLFSLSMLVVSGIGGTLAIVGFLIPWLFIAFNHFNEAKQAFLKNWQLLLLPCLAFVSTAWSEDPHHTFRASLELFPTIAIGILAGSCVKPKAFMVSFMLALALGAALSLAIGNTEIISYTGEIAFSGIFGSKNAFSASMSLLMLGSWAVYMDKSQSKFFRFLAIGGIVFTPFLLYHGRSLDAVVGVAFTLIAYLSVLYLRRFHSTMRGIALFFILILIVSALIFLTVSEINPLSALTLVGKDATLTGRTFLWQKAMHYIAEQPLLGDGYAAFWRVDNPKAQDLWYMFKLPPGSGLGFHDEYVGIAVDLGIVGLALMLSYFFILGKNIKRVMFDHMNGEQTFAFLLFTFFIIRTPIEAQFFGPFSVATVLFCVMWIYFYPPAVARKPYSMLNRNENIHTPKVAETAVKFNGETNNNG